MTVNFNLQYFTLVKVMFFIEYNSTSLKINILIKSTFLFSIKQGEQNLFLSFMIYSGEYEFLYHAYLLSSNAVTFRGLKNHS